MARAKKRRGPRLKARKHVSLAAMPFNGDHGTGTDAANSGTVVEAIKNDKGGNPNHMGRRRRVEVIDTLTLTVRQQQAAKAIRDAYCRVESLSSGGPLKERVQASPKPDATIAAQVSAQSAYVHVMRGVRPIDRAVIEHVCFYNQPLRTFYAHHRQHVRFKEALDHVADHMRY